jgi:hypothetical protein
MELATMIDISKLKKADVLRVLYNASKPQGMGYMKETRADMPESQAETVVAAKLKVYKDAGIDTNETLYFDYVGGRVMKVDIAGDKLDPRLYDRDNGQGAAAAAIEELR